MRLTRQTPMTARKEFPFSYRASQTEHPAILKQGASCAPQPADCPGAPANQVIIGFPPVLLLLRVIRVRPFPLPTSFFDHL